MRAIWCENLWCYLSSKCICLHGKVCTIRMKSNQQFLLACVSSVGTPWASFAACSRALTECPNCILTRNAAVSLLWISSEFGLVLQRIVITRRGVSRGAMKTRGSLLELIIVDIGMFKLLGAFSQWYSQRSAWAGASVWINCKFRLSKLELTSFYCVQFWLFVANDVDKIFVIVSVSVHWQFIVN